MKIPQKSFVQFSLRGLLLLVAVIALSLATFGPWGIAVVVFLAAQAFLFRRAADRVGLIVAWGLVFVLASCVVHGHMEAYRIHSCGRNLNAIGMAMHDYHNEHGHLPPQYVADAEGRPMHSWRVLILPYLDDYLDDSDATKVYQEYRFDEPWNSPHNQKLGARAGDWFRCPTTNDVEPDSPFVTHYVAVAGPGTAWPGRTGTRLKDITDGTGNTVLLVEIADSDIHWMEPRDVSLEDALSDHNGGRSIPSSHHHVERTYFFLSTYPLVGNVLMADGSCHCLQSRPSRDEVAALLSIDGGEPINNDALFEWHRRTAFLRLDVKRCLSYALFVIFFALLVW